MKGLTKTVVTAGVPVFQVVHENAQGGFTLNESVLAAASTVKAGTVIGFDETTRLAKVAKYAVVKNTGGASDTTHEVSKGHNLAVGMAVKTAGNGAQNITVIDTSNANFDTITTAAALQAGAIAAGTAFYVDDDGFNKAKGLLYEEGAVATGEDISVVIRGTVYENRINPVPAVIKALLPNIIFSQSY